MIALSVTNTVTTLLVLAFTHWGLGVVAALCYLELVILWQQNIPADGGWGDAACALASAVIIGWGLQRFRGLNFLEAVGFQTLSNLGAQAVAWIMGL